MDEMAPQTSTGTPTAAAPAKPRVSVANGFIRRPTIRGRQVTIIVFPDFFQVAEMTIWPVTPEQKAKNPGGPDVYAQIQPKYVAPATPGATSGQVMGMGGETAPSNPTPATPTGGDDQIPF